MKPAIVATGCNSLPKSTIGIFLSFKDFKEQATRNPGPGRHDYCSLGKFPFDWYRVVQKNAWGLYEKLLRITTQELSRNRREPISDRAAEVLVGHLLKAFCFRVARAEAQLEMAAKTSQLFHGGSVIRFERPPDTSSSMRLVSSRHFGGYIETLVAAKTSLKTCGPLTFHRVKWESNTGASRAIKNLVLDAIRNLTTKVATRNRVFIHGSRLGVIREVALNLAFHQVPVMGARQASSSIPVFLPIPSKPDQLLMEKQPDLRDLFLELIPKSIWEPMNTGNSTGKYALRRPAVIFTSESFTFDDQFKNFVVQHLEHSTYIVGQHGNNYEVSNLVEPLPELRTCSRFLSWGWSGQGVSPIGLFTTFSLENPSRKRREIVLLLQSQQPFHTYMDDDFRTSLYLSSLQVLIENLTTAGIVGLLKPNSGTETRMLDELSRMLEGNGNFKILPSAKKLSNRGLKKLPRVFCYDSTGMLEHASRGIPFFAFMPEGMSHVKAKFLANYAALVEAGLLETNAERASEKIDVWLNDSLSQADAAMDKFSLGIVRRKSNREFQDLKSALSQALNENLYVSGSTAEQR